MTVIQLIDPCKEAGSSPVFFLLSALTVLDMAHTFLEKFAAVKVKLLMCHLSTWITEGSARPTMTLQNVRHVQTKLCGGRVSANGISPSHASLLQHLNGKVKLNYFLYSITSLGLFGPHQNKYRNLLIL